MIWPLVDLARWAFASGAGEGRKFVGQGQEKIYIVIMKKKKKNRKENKKQINLRYKYNH